MLSANPIIRDLEIMAPARNYGRWIYRQVEPALGQRLIECGAGIGNFTELLSNRELVVALDSYAPCLEYLRKRFAQATHIIPIQMDISTPDMLGLASYEPDTIVCINVLEHVQDDTATLSNMWRILQRGGQLALLVPAFQALYGSIDRVVGHYRRYGKQELQEKLIRGGFHIKDLFYMNVVAPLGWFLNNRIWKRTEESPTQVMVFDRWIVPWLSKLERALRPPFGLSLIALAEK
jgi:SAM-dependent methyltransferase